MIITTLLGTIIVGATVFLNCYVAYIEGLTNLRYDMQVIIDSLLLNETDKNRLLIFAPVNIGYTFIVCGLEIFIICWLLRKGIIPTKKASNNQ
jgi:hypothetical protein